MYNRPEYQSEAQTIAKYIKRETMKEFKETHPTLPDDMLLDKMLAEFIPRYKPFTYCMDITEEFASEDPFSAKVILEYLVSKCPGCISADCLKSHPSQNLRRAPMRLFNGIWNYLPELCKVQNCSPDCEFSHNPEESLYHPMTYKTTRCEFPLQNGQCKERGIFCPFAHGAVRKPSVAHFVLASVARPEEEKIDTVFVWEKFKTSPCKLVTVHDRAICVYYHDNKDCRRDPTKYNYDAQRCPAGFNRDYKCRYKEKCKFAHNEIEELYHKEVYLTKPCKTHPCKLGEKCPYSHQAQAEPKENIRESLKRYAHANSVLKEELEKVQQELQEISIFLCFFCNTEASESILMCGHLTCAKCIHGDYCDICFKPIYPIIQIKLQ